MSKGREMKERPILFNGEMVRAILEGRKTQTRRVVKPQPDEDELCNLSNPALCLSEQGDLLAYESKYPEEGCMDLELKCPFGQPGDRLWVREAWCCQNPEYLKAYQEEPWRGDPCRLNAEIYYAANDPHPEQLRWKPSIHMPRWASRITFEITNVRVERLQEISRVDAISEGIPPWPSMRCDDEGQPVSNDEVKEFGRLWNSLAKPGQDWADNPWVWVVEFKRAEGRK